ncbi:hypothetical protein JMA_03640 [Jeotgalibacillus malaysiensis]|uniref:N-acetyltransferase domain-containing protein n=1 Tax=Jeotgalibacillus malaysiensis TaxID=1508404 RepID=A0A0B5AHY6_9BACL|nr:GNAT family protein [Jeotgalibacillus malaysiensis]AJD89681.1 hypothetical protein JMA_03640 [Jeotgalibacillus malaysiensis]
MSLYQVQYMTIEAAQQINQWTYEEPYDLYSMSGDPDDLDELMDGTYFAVYENAQLIGYFCYGKNAQVPAGRKAGLYEETAYLDIGLGLHPELTGDGKGFSFLSSGLAFGQAEYSAGKFRLSVADFNKRAIRLYENAGFEETASFVHVNNGHEIEFLLMEKV